MVTKKIELIRNETIKMRTEVKQYTQQIKQDIRSGKYHSHKETQQELQYLMRDQVRSLRETGDLSTESRASLNQTPNVGAFKKFVMEYIMRTPVSTAQKYQDSIKNTEKELSKIPKSFKI